MNGSAKVNVDQQCKAGIKSPIRHQLFIGGKFVDAIDGETQTSVNPHGDTAIVDVAMAGNADADEYCCVLRTR